MTPNDTINPLTPIKKTRIRRTIDQRRAALRDELATLEAKQVNKTWETARGIVSATISLQEQAEAAKLPFLAKACRDFTTSVSGILPKQ